jgi:hypothetical protein
LLLAFILAGCAAGQKPTTSPSAAASDGTLVPADAQWTIVCRTFTDDAHHLEATQLKQRMIDAGLKGAYIVEASDHSTLYYGYYAQRNDPRVRADIQRLSQWTDGPSDHPIPHPLLVELDPSDPPAPPQWDLRNAKGYWSLEIAAYRDSPQRKQAAVDSVRAAREQGIEAYYYHGPTISSVCIGAWPRDALKEQSADHAGTSSQNSDQPIVVTNIPLGNFVHGPLVDRETGKQVQVFAPNVQIQNPSLLAAMRKYPYHYVNGILHASVATDPRTGRKVDSKDPSFLVAIPGAEQRYDNGQSPSPNTVSPGNTPPPSILGIQRAPSAPTGKLKSLGD